MNIRRLNARNGRKFRESAYFQVTDASIPYLGHIIPVRVIRNYSLRLPH